MAPQALTRVSGRYPLLALGAVTVALIGYLGYVFYPRFDVPAGSGAGLFLLAIGSGIASFFSPCSFPLLVSILARSPVGDRGRFRSVLTFAGALSLGATAFLLLFGLLIALGAGTLFEDVTFTSAAGRAIRITVGALLVLLGLVQLNRLPISFRGFEPAMHGFLRRQATLRRRRPLLGFTLFGFGYLLAGFG